MTRGNCGDCRFWEKTGMEDSGLPDGWQYPVGKCKSPQQYLGTYAGSGKNNIPAWVSDYCFKRGGNYADPK